MGVTHRSIVCNPKIYASKFVAISIFKELIFSKLHSPLEK